MTLLFRKRKLAPCCRALKRSKDVTVLIGSGKIPDNEPARDAHARRNDMSLCTSSARAATWTMDVDKLERILLKY